jgi:hypothetical protein
MVVHSGRSTAGIWLLRTVVASGSALGKFIKGCKRSGGGASQRGLAGACMSPKRTALNSATLAGRSLGRTAMAQSMAVNKAAL